MRERLTPFQMGERDYRAGKTPADAPWPPHCPEGIKWMQGYDEAAKDDDGPDDGEVRQIVPVRLIFDDGRVRVTDRRGRILEGQMGLVMEQTDDGRFNISVSFAGLKLEGMATGGIVKLGTQLA